MQNVTDEVLPAGSIRKLLVTLFLLAATCVAQTQPAPAPAAPANSPGYLEPLPQDTGAAGLKQELRKLQTTGRLMMVTAHPDDEDGGLLTREARGQGVQTLLLTLTRGEGGQNKQGSSLFDVLGVLRTLELLASDRYYGVEQRFTRVADFGYSKTADETCQKWGGHDIALGDMVRVIRTFRPDVLVARFSGTERDGHGHHQASSILAREAFRAAADPNRFPEQIKEGLQPWQTKKLYIGNVCGFGASTCADENWTVKINTGEEDPVLGMSCVQFAIEGLKHQQSQGLGDIKIPTGLRNAFYKLADSVVGTTKDAAGHEKDFFDGIDTSLPRLAVDADGAATTPWLLSALKKISGRDFSDVNSLSTASAELDSVIERVEEGSLDASRKSLLLEVLSEKKKEAERALNLALDLQFSVDVAPPQGAGTPLPARADALTAVSPGQKVLVVAKLRNNSKKYWITVIRADMVPSEHWIKRKRADP